MSGTTPVDGDPGQISFSASDRAFSNRDGASSVHCIEADASKMITRKLLLVERPAKKGRAIAKIASARTSNCNIKSQLCRNFWKGALACMSAKNFCHNSVLETNFTTRLRLSR